MARPRQSRNWIGLFKDRISIIKAAILLSSAPRRRTTAASFRLAVIHATTHDPSTPPPDDFIDDLLLICHRSPASSSAAYSALISRLNKTTDPFVALKCLITLHRLLSSSGDHYYHSHLLVLNEFDDPVFGSQSFFKPSHFFHDRLLESKWDPDRREISQWVRWYAGEIEQTLIVSRVLGFPFSSGSVPPPPPPPLNHQNSRIRGGEKKKVSSLSTWDLVRQLGALASMVEHLSASPDSLEFQRIGLIFEAVKLAGEDYRLAMRHVFCRTGEVAARVEKVSDEGINEFLLVTERLERCREKMVHMFLNKKRDDGVWEALEEARRSATAEKDRRENSKIVPVVASEGTKTRVGRWLDVEWNKELTVSSSTTITTTTTTIIVPLVEI